MSKSNRTYVDFIAIIVSFALLMGATMAYFTDRATHLAKGVAGWLELEVEAPDNGKRVFTYENMNDYSFELTNKGNKSMDVKAVLTIESNMDIENGAAPTGAPSGTSLPFYRLFNTANPTYSWSYNDATYTFTETGSTPMTGTARERDPNEPATGYGMVYEFNTLLNGTSDKDNETETSGVNSYEIPLKFWFPSYEGILDDWDDIRSTAYYKATMKIYGKQHRNSNDDDWQLLGVYE